MRFISVDLPDPEGPMMATYSLRRIWRLMPRRACTCCSDPMSYVFHRSEVEIMQDSGGADTWGCEMLITSAVAMLFSCSDWDTWAALRPSGYWTRHWGVGL